MRATVRRHQAMMRGVIQKRVRFLIDESVHAGDGGYVEPTALFHIPGLRAALEPDKALCLDLDFAIRKSRWMSSAVFREMMIGTDFCSKRFLGKHGVNGEAFLTWVLQEKQRWSGCLRSAAAIYLFDSALRRRPTGDWRRKKSIQNAPSNYLLGGVEKFEQTHSGETFK